jgi:excisionase family DNA binding protein
MEAYAAAARLELRTRRSSSNQPTTPALLREPTPRSDGALIDEVVGRLADLVVERLMERGNSSDQQSADDWMDAREAAGYLGIHRDTLRKLAAERTVPVHQDGPGCKLYFNRDELDEWRRASKAPHSRLRPVS